MSEEIKTAISPSEAGPPAPPAPVLRFILNSVPRTILGVLILTGVIINFANVLGRHLFGTALFWAEEVLVFIIIWSVFVGIVAITFNGAHLRMDLISAKLPEGWRKAVNGLVWLVFLACALFVVTQSYAVIATFAKNEVVSNAAGVPMVVPHTALFVGFVFVILAVVFRVRAYISGRFD